MGFCLVVKPPPLKSSPSSLSLLWYLLIPMQEGKTICWNYNRVTGCNLYECHFAHVCNRRINGGKACAQAHSFYVLQGGSWGSSPNPTPPTGSQ